MELRGYHLHQVIKKNQTNLLEIDGFHWFWLVFVGKHITSHHITLHHITSHHIRHHKTFFLSQFETVFARARSNRVFSSLLPSACECLEWRGNTPKHQSILLSYDTWRYLKVLALIPSILKPYDPAQARFHNDELLVQKTTDETIHG